MLTVSEAAALLRSFDRVLILTHIRPDGDTVGRIWVRPLTCCPIPG